MANLAPCPFCGSKDVSGYYELIGGVEPVNWYCLKCPKCGAIVTFDEDAAETIHDVERLYDRRV